MLFTPDSPEDLACRGFGREAILELTGFDPGYHTNGLRAATKGVDRMAYKREHVASRVDAGVVLDALGRYGRRELDVVGLLACLGLSNPTVTKLRALFAKTPFEEAFREADRAYRRDNMRAGFAARHDGVENPFELAEYQRRAADTREARYGARYTLAAGSAKADAARATFAEHMRDEAFREALAARKSASCMERYGVDHPMRSDEVKRRVAISRSASGCMRLHREGSANDLFLRGWTPRDAAQASGEAWKKTARHPRASRRLAYCVAHVQGRVGVERLKDAMSAYGRGEIDLDGIFAALGLRRTNDVSVSRLAEAFGLMGEWRASCADLQALRAKDTADMWEERYGVRNVSQLDAVKERKRATMLEHYGVDSALRSPELKEKARSTIRERYGVDNVSQSEEIKRRKVETSRAHYGTDYPQQSDAVRVTQSDTLKRRFGIESDDVVYPFQIAEVRKTAADACERSIGVRNPFESAEVRCAIRQTWQREYGVANPSQVPEFQRRREQTMRERYGVDNFMHLEDSVEIIRDAKRRNGTLSGSVVERCVSDMLVDVFGADDVMAQHASDPRYPFACDFYVRSRDLFIELNGLWVHGGHWHGGSGRDASRLAEWAGRHTPYYDHAVHVWSKTDVAKREAARRSHLNYVVFWDGTANLSDARLWFALGCPDGRDWEREYSWLPDRHLSLVGEAPRLTGTWASATKVARWANGHIFYGRELAMWEENEFQRTWGTLQAQLYANRHKYLRSGADGRGLWQGKLPGELSDLEIVRGLGIMGKLRAYSTFDNSAMVDVISRHGIESVIDPCAGWGERLATCCWLGLPYLGIDVNPSLPEGYGRIIGEYGDTGMQRCVCADAATHAVDGEFDAAITCPPYGGLEHYSDLGAENLDAAGFAAWWDGVVANIGPHVRRLFCVQTNQACKGVFERGLEAAGWHLVESVGLSRRSGHMTRRRGGVDTKREFEEMLVFERVSG